MTSSEKAAIQAFVNSLQRTPGGRAMAVNMLYSEKKGLVSADALRDFLLDCAQTHASRLPPSEPLTVVEAVSCGQGASRRSYLRQCKQPHPSAASVERLSTTMKTDTFQRFLVDRKYKDPAAGLPVVLPPVPVNSRSGLKEYRKRLFDVTTDPTWHAPTATLGKPFPDPSNCWMTTDQFGVDPRAPKYPDDAGREARDELGLVDCRRGSFLLRLSFRASTVSSVSPCELARPTFSDLGNSRFSVSQSSSRATTFAAAGWGATVHLGKFIDKTFADVTGSGERISSSLPVPMLDDLVVVLLGPVTDDRGITVAIDDDDAFASALEAGRSATDIGDELLSVLA